MALLIDPPQSPGHGRLWSHLASDQSFDELHRFAAALGIPRRGFDGDHYDVPAERYDDVVASGAAPVTSRELVARLHQAGLRRRKAQQLRPRGPGARLARATRLHGGDTVAVTSPSGPAERDQLDAGVAVLESWGLSVRLMDNVRHRHQRFSYLSADDEVRAGDFMRAWCDPAVSAVFCSRGGYGAQRMVDLLDWESLRTAGPRVLVGFSDVTALHHAVVSRLGLSTIHGPVLTSLGAGDQVSRDHLRGLLFEPESVVSLGSGESLVPGHAEGVLTGGNLSLLAAGLGTWDSVPARGSIVFLEDVDEELYRLDRLVTQLLRAGWFDGVRALALGQFTGCGTRESLKSLFEDRLAPLGVPMAWDLPIGHGERNLAFPLGVPAALDATAGELALQVPALR